MNAQGVNLMVSILVPVYNAGAYLRDCLESIIGQTFSNLQVVLLNDGSTDNSWDIMKEYADRDERIEIHEQKNQGVAATRNCLLDLAKGDYVLFVDSDDWIDLNTVELLVKELQISDYDIVSFQMAGTDNNTQGQFTQEQTIRLFLEHQYLNGSLCNKLIKRELFRGLRFDESISYGEDALMVWRVLQRVKYVDILNNHLYHVGVNRESLSRQRLNDKKFTVFNVWDTICKDADKDWPQYSKLAHARFACEMTLILRDAVKSGYGNMEQIRPLQKVIRRDCRHIVSTGISTPAMSAFAWIVSHSYWLACRISRFVW